MNKILSLITMFIFVGTSFAGTAVFRTGANSDGTYEFNMVQDEGLLIGNGTPSVTMNGEDAYIEGTFENATPSFNPPICIITPAAASGTAFDSFSISTATLISGATTLTLAAGDYTDIIHPRNLVFRCDFTGDESTMTVTASVTVTGTDAKGTSTTETIAFSTNTGTGNVAWSTITSIAYSATVIQSGLGNTAILTMGSGTKIGLPTNISSSGEILKVIGNNALDTTYTLNTTYDTIVFATAPNGSYNYMVYAKPVLR